MTKNRWFINLTIFLVLVVGCALAISVYISSEFGHDQVLFLFPVHVLVWGGLLLPGALLHLWILEVSAGQSKWNGRVRAVALSPLLTVGPVTYFLAIEKSLGSYEWRFLWPTALLYGILSRLPSSAELMSNPDGRPASEAS